MIFQDFDELIRSIQNHVEGSPGAIILSKDNAFKRLLGFESNRGESWEIPLTSLRQSELSQEALDLMRVVEGRAELARRLTAGEAPFPQAV